MSCVTSQTFNQKQQRYGLFKKFDDRKIGTDDYHFVRHRNIDNSPIWRNNCFYNGYCLFETKQEQIRNKKINRIETPK